MPRHIAALLHLPALILTPLLLGGCASSVQYVIQQGIGQICVIINAQPIDDVLASGQLDPEQQRKLHLIVEARDFAHNQLGLRAGRSYTTFHDTGGDPVGFNLSACRQDSLTPKSWRFPIIGTIDYIGFFSEQDALQAAADLQADGYDTYIYAVDAYSTLGWFPDPVHSPFLNRADGQLVETVIHELAHNTIYVNGQSTFNESLATFIGRQGARLFFEPRGDQGHQIIAALEQTYADDERVTAWIDELIAALTEHYAQDLSSADKIAGREAVFQAARDRFLTDVQPQLIDPQSYAWWANLPTNNALVLLHQRYHLDLDVFTTAYEQTGRDFAPFLDLLRAAAATDDPFDYLHQTTASP